MLANRVGTVQHRVEFFQNCIVRMLDYWRNHDAIQHLHVAVLDREREAILSVISLALDFTPAWPLVHSLITAFTRYMEGSGHWVVWNTILHRAIQVAQQQGDVAGETTLFVLLARLAQRRGDFEAVVYNYRRVIGLARQTDNRYEEARACCNLGYYYIDAGHWWRSEVLSCRALRIFETLESAHGLAHTYNHLGVLYMRQRRWPQAEENLLAACALWQQMHDESQLIYGYMNLGSFYLETEQYDTALQYLEKAADLAESQGEISLIGGIWNNLGVAYQQLGDMPQAKSYLHKASENFRTYANLLGMAQVEHNLGEVALQQQNWNKAIHHLENAGLSYRTLSNYEGQTRILGSLIEYHLATRNRVDAATCIDELAVLARQHTQGEQLRYLEERIQEFHKGLDAVEAL